jgi:beta-galactosidase
MKMKSTETISRRVLGCARRSILALIVAMTLPMHLPASQNDAGANPVNNGLTRKVISFNSDWEYRDGDARGVRSEIPWQRVNLPHTWNRTDVLDAEPGYRRGSGWYRKEFRLPDAPRDAQFILSFEGINMKGEVYVNGALAGGHIGGYVGFDVNISSFVKRDTTNTIMIKADNGIDPNVIPSQRSDFFLYGGISRNVWMKILPGAHLDSLLIRPHSVSGASGETEARFSIVNPSRETMKLVCDAMIKDPRGREVSKKEMSVTLQPGSTEFVVALPTVKGPMLWSPSHPNLYTLTIKARSSGKVVDEVSDRFGYRWYEFKDHGPFFLNGERLLLRGTHRHEELSGYGNAIPDSLQRMEIKMIKEMGANFVRLAHYPQAREVYRACDELGLLVWDELPWCRGGMGGEEWKANTRRLLKEQVTQNFNHPCIILWSLGNEIDWMPDFPGGDNTDSLRAFLSELNAIAHRLDPERPTATRRFDEGGDIVDVHSPSIWMGWYASSSGYFNYEKAITDANKKFKHFFHAEYGGDSHVGRHTENPVGGDGFSMTAKGKEPMLPVDKKGDWSENYIVDLFDWHLQVSEQSTWLSGNAQWIFKDFGTPLRPENPIPYVNQKGLVDMAGKPKDAYYVYKSYWSSDPKFCYVESHTWTERTGMLGEKREVKVYSNCPEVELFVNGVSAGKVERDISKFPACGLHWLVEFHEGQNVLRAVGYVEKKAVTADSMSLLYSTKKSGSVNHINFASENLSDGSVRITAYAVDVNDRHCLDYNKRIYFSLIGDGTLLEGYGTATRSSVIEMANGKAQIDCLPGLSGNTILEARNQDCKGDYFLLRKNP